MVRGSHGEAETAPAQTNSEPSVSRARVPVIKEGDADEVTRSTLAGEAGAAFVGSVLVHNGSVTAAPARSIPSVGSLR
jgi:hypothetical protein